MKFIGDSLSVSHHQILISICQSISAFSNYRKREVAAKLTDVTMSGGGGVDYVKNGQQHRFYDLCRSSLEQFISY